MHGSNSKAPLRPRATSSGALTPSLPSSSSARSVSRASTRPPSSASTRPPSSASTRPPSSASSIRPSSSSSLLPSSSSGYGRPSSSASTRPNSRLTQRPGSRYSQRPPSRQASRILHLHRSLVTQITGLNADEDPENFQTAVDFVTKNLDPNTHPPPNSDITTIDKHIRGHVQKARVNSNDALANALETSYNHLKEQSLDNTDLDAELQLSRLPAHLQLLVMLSLPPTQATLDYAEYYNAREASPPEKSSTLTWEQILAEEPFEGQHWEGVYGLPPGSTVEGWETQSRGSTPSLSPMEDSDDPDDSLSSTDFLDHLDRDAENAAKEELLDVRSHQTYSHREDIENLRARQYWRPDWRTDANVSRPFNIGEASTLAPALQRALASRAILQIDGPEREKYIHEHDAVREVLMGLQGRRNFMLTRAHNGDFMASQSLRLLHFTATAQLSILSTFAKCATALDHLRRFVSAIFAKASQGSTADARPSRLASWDRRNTRTLEAFADAVDASIRDFDNWCATKEEEISLAQGGIGPPRVISLLSLEKTIRDKFSDAFFVLLQILQELVKRATRSPEPIREIWTLLERPMRITPSAFTAQILDSLHTTAQDCLSMGDLVTSRFVMVLFNSTAEPVWSMIQHWMLDGMRIQDIAPSQQNGLYNDGSLDDEFFIEDNGLNLLDPDFWTEGFTLRDTASEDGPSRLSSIPAIFVHVAPQILSAGKAIGLLRLLGVPSLFDREAEQPWLASWKSFQTIAQISISDDTEATSRPDTHAPLMTASTHTLSQAIQDELVPNCLVAQSLLTQILTEECELWRHLQAMEDLFLMRRGDAMSHFVDVLFTRMNSRHSWTDFHFLNSAFHDVATVGSFKWIDPALVRISHRGSRDKTIGRTVRAIEGLTIEYAVPFPLSYIFGPRSMLVYSSIFSFILQIRRSKDTLDTILVRGTPAGSVQTGGDMKAFYAMRSKLSWFVNSLLNFVATNVLHTQVLDFHSQLRKATSLETMIQLHEEHLGKMEGRCLLQRNTAALHRAIMSILDMALHFSECFVAFAGDTTHDISRHSVVLTKRHRSRRQRRQRKNVIGFSQTLHEVNLSSDSDSDLDEDTLGHDFAEPSVSFGASAMSLAEEGFVARLDKMSSELDALVRFVRRGVESLAGGTSEAAAAFGIYAFALEDWDR